MKTLQQDNHKKIKITLKKEVLLFEIIKYFRWRKNKNNFKYNLNRLYKEGSLEYDAFIEYLFYKYQK